MASNGKSEWRIYVLPETLITVKGNMKWIWWKNYVETYTRFIMKRFLSGKICLNIWIILSKLLNIFLYFSKKCKSWSFIILFFLSFIIEKSSFRIHKRKWIWFRRKFCRKSLIYNIVSKCNKMLRHRSLNYERRTVFVDKSSLIFAE